MNVSAVVVTRGDVDLEPVLESIPAEWDLVVWNNNSARAGHSARWWRWPPNTNRYWHFGHGGVATDLSVYGRYAAIEYARQALIYVQDDDVIVSNPQALVDAWRDEAIRRGLDGEIPTNMHVACNMPQEFRHPFYEKHALVGFGAVFHRDAPELAFDRFWSRASDVGILEKDDLRAGARFQRTCDVVFTALSQCVLVDVPKENLPCAYADNRMWLQPEHTAERMKTLELALAAR